MLNLNRSKYINWLCAIVFFLAAGMFTVGATSQSGKDILLGLGLMCITFPSLVGLFKTFKNSSRDNSIETVDEHAYKRLSLLGLILTIVALVFF